MVDISGITDLLQIIAILPTGYKILFIFIFFLLPKIIQMLGGPKVVSEIIKRYQARKARQLEDQALTEAYTRTLVVESLGMFAIQLRRIDHKINHIVGLLDPEAEIELIETTSPKRTYSDTVIHHSLHRELEKVRKRHQEID